MSSQPILLRLAEPANVERHEGDELLWRATSSDPNFKLVPLGGETLPAGAYRLLALGAEGLDRLSNPCLYADLGDGFHERNRIPLTFTPAPGRLEAAFQVESDVRALRFDPSDTPGEFRLSVCAIETIPSPDAVATHAAPSFHIVLCTFNPDLVYFEQQIRSLQAQTRTDWTCEVRDDGSTPGLRVAIAAILADDRRFRFVANPTRLGVYHNFEAGVKNAPEDAQFIAYCDQDDVWAPNKLERLVEAFNNPDVMLAHSDLSMIDAQSNLLHRSVFTFERRNLSDFSPSQLLIRNAVTGCSAAFRTTLRPLLLPFPRQDGPVVYHHDLWTALVATQIGRIATIREPLVHYRQHGRNVVGAEQAKRVRAKPKADFDARARAWIREWELRAHIGSALLDRVREARRQGITISNRLPGRDLAGLKEISTGRFIAPRLVWRGLTQSARGLPAGTVALDTARGQAILNRPRVFSTLRRKGQVWRDRLDRWGLFTRAVASFVRRAHTRRSVFQSLLDQRARRLGDLPAGPPGPVAAAAVPVSDYGVTVLEDVYSGPFPVALDQDSPRLVICAPSMRVEHLFGGMTTILKLASALARRGVKIVLLSFQFPMETSDQAATRQFMLDHADLIEEAAGNIEITAFNHGPLKSHPKDLFLATIWWSARRISDTLDLGLHSAADFYYLIQDFEPNFYPWSDEYALAMSTYDLNIRPIVNTTLLADHLRSEMGNVTPPGRILRPAIDLSLYSPPSADDILSRSRPRLVFYGRPATPRNLFGIGIAALKRFAAQLQLTDGDIDIVSAGEAHPDIALGPNLTLRAAGKLSMQAYPGFLRESDIGLSLMLSPHPSYPPFEMAASGMSVVTNNYRGKVMNFSDNMIAVSASPEAVCDGLVRAWNRVRNAQARIAGSGVSIDALGRTMDEVADDLADEIKIRLDPGANPDEHRARQSEDVAHVCPFTGLKYIVHKDFAPSPGARGVCLVSHFDMHAKVDAHVLDYLDALRQIGLDVILVSSVWTLDPESFAHVSRVCAGVLSRENRGYDFAGWSLTMRLYPDILAAPQLVLTNDSNYVAVPALLKMWQVMEARACDYWGVSENFEIERHIQSYMITFRQSALRSQAFQDFWSRVIPLADKDAIIKRFEVGLAEFFDQRGLRGDILVAHPDLGGEPGNPTHWRWRDLLEIGSPFLKVQLLRDNPVTVDLTGWREAFAAAGGDPERVQEHLRRVGPRTGCAGLDAA